MRGRAEQSVERSVVLAAPPEEVWRALTEPDRLAAWYGSRVELQGRPGGRVVVAGDDGERWGTVECFQPGRLLVLRLWERSGELSGTRVAFRLDPTDGGTRLTVVETRLGRAEARAAGARPPVVSSRG